MNEKILVGKIVKTRGLKGEMVLQSFCQPEKAFLDYPEYWILDRFKSFKKLEISSKAFLKNKSMRIMIKDIDSIDKAELFRNTDVYIDKKFLKETSEDEFFYHEVLESEVFIGDKFIGKVISTQNFGAGDLLEVFWEEKSRNIYLPILKEYLENFDLENKKIIYQDIDGLL